MSISEKDWKVFKSLRDGAFKRASENILKEYETLINNRKDKEIDTLYELWDSMKESKKIISRMFDDYRRSTASLIISNWRYYGAITDEEFERFSPELKEQIK